MWFVEFGGITIIGWQRERKNQLWPIVLLCPRKLVWRTENKLLSGTKTQYSRYFIAHAPAPHKENQEG